MFLPYFYIGGHHDGHHRGDPDHPVVEPWLEVFKGGVQDDLDSLKQMSEVKQKFRVFNQYRSQK